MLTINAGGSIRFPLTSDCDRRQRRKRNLVCDHLSGEPAIGRTIKGSDTELVLFSDGEDAVAVLPVRGSSDPGARVIAELRFEHSYCDEFLLLEKRTGMKAKTQSTHLSSRGYFGTDTRQMKYRVVETKARYDYP